MTKPIKNWNALEVSEEDLGLKSISDQLFDYQADAIRKLMDQQIMSKISVAPSFVTNYSLTADHTWATRARAPLITSEDKEISVIISEGVTESISREDLIKYMDERKLVQENEVVRKMYERYQVAVKLARSDNNGDTGE